MDRQIFEILSNKKLTDNVFEMILGGDTKAIKASGQFVNIKIDGFYLRRPISVCDYSQDKITLIYKVVGAGTKKLSEMQKGESLDLLVGLGNGFDITRGGDDVLLVGGGVGVPPLYNLCKALVKMGKTVTVVMGFNTKSEIFYEEEFKACKANVIVTTVDGSYGVHGFVTDAIKKDYSYLFTCGPLAMLKAVYETGIDGQFSFEERMGCGFGACMGCTCKTKYGNKRICKDGPVLLREEIIW